MSKKFQLESLRSLSSKLNEASDNLNAIIPELNATLQAMNIGVAVWLDPILDERIVAPDYDQTHPNTPDDASPDHCIGGYELGYACCGDSWQLCVREITWNKTVGEYFYQGPPEPLLNAPRVVRLQACARFDSLIQALHATVDRYLNDIKQAHATAKKGGSDGAYHR